MEKLIPFTISDLSKVTKQRSGEIKFGEKMLTVPVGLNALDFIKNCEAKYVLFGIPEDIGVRANYGRPGASVCWDIAIESIANLQHNKFCKGDLFLILGTLDVKEEMNFAQNLKFQFP